jgi:stage II sporulation protein GA (sporulation sigma-E factor processing peptidase)
MKTEVYADILFAVTGLMLFTVYGSTALTFGIRVRLTRLIFGSSVTSLISTAAMLLLRDIINPVSILVLVMLGTYLCLGTVNPKDNIIYSLTALAYAALIAGVKTAIANIGLPGNNTVGVILTGGMLYAASFVCLKRIKSAIVKKQQLCRITVCKGSKSVQLTALVDTGNELTGPDSESVIIAERSAVSCLFDQAQAETDLRLIPYTSIGKSNGVLMGVLCDCILINDIRRERVIVAASDSLCSSKYNALISPSITGPNS